jgi:toxin ParE1/3/4
MFDVFVEERAEIEFYAAMQYYEQLDITGLTEKFYLDYFSVIRQLEINPFFELKIANYRGLHFEKFPFIAFFTIDESNKIVKIVSIFHSSQDPDKYPQ